MSEIKLLQGDCLELMKDIPDGSIDMILTDPPYGINLTPQRKTSKFKNEKIPNDDNLEWLPEVATEYKRILKDDSVGYVFCNWQNYDVFKQVFEKEFTIKNCLVWDKDWFGMGNNWRPNHEFILVIANGKFKTKSRNKSNILTYRRLSPHKLLHSCEKPVSLLEELIKESTDEEDVILDSFLGSGTTGVACKNLNRNFIGMELDEDYFNIAKERIENHELLNLVKENVEE